MTPPSAQGPNPLETRLSRRDLLKLASAGAITLGAGGLLEACGSSSTGSSSTTTTAPAGKPKRGGTLVLGASGGSSTDTLDALNIVNGVDFARVYQLYDSLVAFDENALPKLQLAESIEPNADATVWTIRLRSGVTWHNGKAFTADDVIYTFQRILDPKHPAYGATSIASMDVKHIKKLDSLTLQVPFLSPFSTFVETLPCYTYFVVPVGYDPPNDPSFPRIGTGPFKFQSFVPGETSLFVRNENYWDGPPYVDAIRISDFSDETSQVNALISGQVNLIDQLTSTSVTQLKQAGLNYQSADGGGYVMITMRVDVPPFNDVRVRQALRLCVDRPQMRDLQFDGAGLLGNDIFGRWDTVYDDSLPQRQQDIPQAKFLLKQAGQENLTVTFVTANETQGSTSEATIFAQQASAAGVKVNLQTVSPSTIFGPNYLKWHFSQDQWYYFPYFPMVGFNTLPTSTISETHFNNPVYTSLYKQGSATVDAAKRTEIAHAMQKIDYDSGGAIIPNFYPVIDGFAKNVMGITKGKTGISFNDFSFNKVWID
jgi:peptide/nickel transport system substrate-binding protein